jgi:hypothetical protein
MPKRVTRHAVEQPLDQNIKLIALTQGQNAIVSAVDYESLIRFNWFAHWHPNRNSFYVKAWIGDKFVGMHTFLIPCRPGCVPDHIDGNTLDNRRDNLQELPHGLNLLKGHVKSHNTSGHSGVCWDSDRSMYMVRVSTRHIGRYSLLADAIEARNKEVESLFSAGGFKLS